MEASTLSASSSTVSVRLMMTTLHTTVTARTTTTMRRISMRAATRSIICFLIFLPTLPAQTKESLLIGPGDLLHVQVFDTPELEEHARVTDAGELPLVLGGSVRVAGLTPGEAGH